jgi:hypothetical protein
VTEGYGGFLRRFKQISPKFRERKQTAPVCSYKGKQSVPLCLFYQAKAKLNASLIVTRRGKARHFAYENKLRLAVGMQEGSSLNDDQSSADLIRWIAFVGVLARTFRRLQIALGCVSKERASAIKRNDIFKNPNREPPVA